MNCNMLELQHTSGTRAMNANVQNVEQAWQPANLDEQGPSTAHSQKGSIWKVEAWMGMPLRVLTASLQQLQKVMAIRRGY